ncbi:MAG: SMP-30/gluconolactonase/LRE family protein [Pseudolysinimonas sp.]
MAHEAVAATDAVYHLAEGVIWDAGAARARWVDIDRGRLHSGRIDGTRIVDIDTVELGRTEGLEQTAGAVAPAADGGLLVAAARGLATVSVTGDISFGPAVIDRGRLNDGAVDPQGRFVVGSLSPEQDEVLLRIAPDGSVETLRTGVRLSNGIGFSPDGGTIYHVDTYAGTVSASADDGATWRVLIDDLPHPPDGMTVSSDGDLWIAQYGGACVLRCTPTGRVVDEVTIDAPQATCPAFVGPGLGMLAITSAQENLDHWSDHSGAIFLDASPGATGVPVTPWPGSTTHPYWKGTA